MKLTAAFMDTALNEIWTSFIGEDLGCKHETNQIPDMHSYAVGIM